jgi:hypothetical protein
MKLFELTLVTSLSILIVSPLRGQTEDSSVRKLVRQQVYTEFSPTPGDLRPFSVPLPVLQTLIVERTRAGDWDNLQKVATKHSPYTKLDASEVLLRTLRTKLTITRQALLAESFGLKEAPALATDVSLLPHDNTLLELQSNLQSASAVNVEAIQKLEEKLKPIQAAAILTLRADFNGNAELGKQVLANARVANQEMRNILDTAARVGSSDFTTLRNESDAILKTLDEQVQKAMGPIPEQLEAARSYYEKLTNVALKEHSTSIIRAVNGQTQQLLGVAPPDIVRARAYYEGVSNLATQVTQSVQTGKIPSFPKSASLTPAVGLQLLQSLGALNNAHAELARSLHDDGDALAKGLEQGIGILNGGWDQLSKAAGRVDAPNIANPVLPEQIKNLAPFVRDLDSLNDILKGNQPVGVPQISRALAAVGVLPQGTALAQASTALSTIISKKADYSNAATGVMTTLSALNSAGISIPGFQQIAPVLNTANSILQAAGPLTTIAGFATGLSAFQMIGGLGGLGGGGDDSVNQALSQINAKLDQINHKLDVVIEKLDQLDDKITKQHMEVMNALEAIGFDVARSNKLLLMQLHKTVKVPCLRAANGNDDDFERQLAQCHQALSDLYVDSDPTRNPPGELRFETNLTTYNASQTAFGEFKTELTYRRDLSNLLTTTNCQALAYPSSDLDELNYKLATYGKRNKANDCQSLLESNLLEPRIVSEYVLWEQNAFAATPRLGIRKTIDWWQGHGKVLNYRWTSKELPLLNLAIAQQAGVTGDVLLGELAQSLDQSFKDDAKLAELKKIWTSAGVLPENIARYWIWSRIGTQALINSGTQNDNVASQAHKTYPWLRTLYAFAWESGDDRYWYLLTRAPTDKVKFTFRPRKIINPDGTEGQEMVWMVQFRDLPEVPMAKPSEMNLLELRWPSTLAQLVEARERLLVTLGSMNYAQQSWRKQESSAKDLLEAMVISTVAPK